MGLFNALTSSVGGLQAQSFAIQNISGNIANSQTIAYKDINTSFLDLVSSASVPSQQVAGGVLASSQATNTVQGAIQNATVSTDMAINGDGYFIVQPPLSFSGNTPIFGGSQQLYAARRLLAEFARLPRQRRRLLSLRSADRSHDGRSDRQRCGSAAISKQLFAG